MVMESVSRHTIGEAREACVRHEDDCGETAHRVLWTAGEINKKGRKSIALRPEARCSTPHLPYQSTVSPHLSYTEPWRSRGILRGLRLAPVHCVVLVLQFIERDEQEWAHLRGAINLE